MSVLGKVTAVLLILLGLVVIVAGLFIAGSGAVRAMQQGPGLNELMPFMDPAVTAGFSAAAGIIVLIQGLMLTALGEGLYLLAQIADRSAENSRMLARRPVE